MDWAVDFEQATIRMFIGTLGGLDHLAGTFDDNLAFASVYRDDGTALAFVVAGNDFDFVAFFDVCLHQESFSGDSE